MSQTDRYIEIRLREQLAEGCRIFATPSQLVIDMQLDHPWPQVLENLNELASTTERERLRFLFESFTDRHNIEFKGDYVSICEWPRSSHGSTQT